MAKKKRNRKSREQIERDAENSPIVRQLRELYARGMADLEARKAQQQG
jgi:hypothetical protein